jgi:hypothetical protein
VPDKKTVVLIPYWIQEILKRNQLPLSACLDLNKINVLLSVNDLCGFLALQNTKYFKLVTGSDKTYSLLTDILSDSIAKTDSELRYYFFNTIEQLKDDISFSNELEARLFNVDSKLNEYNEAFSMYDLSPEACGIVIYPGYFTTNNIVLQKAVVESIIEILYVYLPFHKVAKTVYFEQYLKLLSSSN